MVKNTQRCSSAHKKMKPSFFFCHKVSAVLRLRFIMETYHNWVPLHKTPEVGNTKPKILVSFKVSNIHSNSMYRIVRTVNIKLDALVSRQDPMVQLMQVNFL